MERSHNFPHEVFQAAQQAMARGDWEAFFACLHRTDLIRLGALALGGLGHPSLGRPLMALCLECGVPASEREALQRLGAQLEASARAVLADPGSRERSLCHRDLVKGRERALEAAVKRIGNLAAFNARAERLKRDVMGGGSVSSSMFQGEALHDVAVEGDRATGVRRRADCHEMPVAFARWKGGWTVKLLPPRNARPIREARSPCRAF